MSKDCPKYNDLILGCSEFTPSSKVIIDNPTTLQNFKTRYPRAMKLIERGEQFMVIKCSEPYASDVATLIKTEELSKGEWTEEDEQWMLDNIK